MKAGQEALWLVPYLLWQLPEPYPAVCLYRDYQTAGPRALLLRPWEPRTGLLTAVIYFLLPG